MSLIHATCVAFPDGALLLRAREGGGKSDLALRLIDAGARLISDDQVELKVEGEALMATAPATIRGKFEVRGLGIVAMDASPPSRVVAVVDLSDKDRIERMPEAASCEIEGVRLPLFRLHPFDASAPAKARLMVEVAAGRRTVER